ncbi:MAG TPA: type II secretion system protein, partial [Phycisphaerae bacterium]|nr:type II secretion system protein [Phycisphaerae bacterium]
MTRASRTRIAFSLVELLVTIAIIATLLAILLPVLSGARLQAKQVACLANLRTLGQTMDMYLQHYGPTYPPVDGFPMGPQFNLMPDDAKDITKHTGCLPLSFHPILPGTPTLISEV